MEKIKPGSYADFPSAALEGNEIGSGPQQNEEERYAGPTFCIEFIVSLRNRGRTLTGIKCPYCRSSLALDRIGVHFQKFCSGILTIAARETSMKKYNQFYSQLQSHSRGEITAEELQAEADKLFLSGK
jgi:hypothetical protein